MIHGLELNPRELVKRVDEFSNFQLQKRDDLQRFFAISMEGKNYKLFEETIFTAKYVLGLMRVMKKGASFLEIESLEHVKKDLTENMEKISGQIRELISSASEIDNNYFEEKFLKLDADSFLNLNKLLEDLEWTKKYFNDLKRN